MNVSFFADKLPVRFRTVLEIVVQLLMALIAAFGIGLCHPPVGSILFVGCDVGKVSIEQVMRKIWPFYTVMFLVLMLVTYLPQISLWLPRHVLR